MTQASKLPLTSCWFACLLCECRISIPGRKLSYSESCRMFLTDTPWDTMPHLSWPGCEPARRVNRAERGPDLYWLKRTVALRNQRGLRATFRPPTLFVAALTRTCGAKRNGRHARDAGRSCRCLLALEPTLVASWRDRKGRYWRHGPVTLALDGSAHATVAR